MKKYFTILILIFSLLSCNEERKDYYGFLNDSMISDRNGFTTSYFPFDSIRLEEYICGIDSNGYIYPKIPISDTIQIKLSQEYYRPDPEVELFDTILPKIYSKHKDYFEEYYQALNEKILYNYFLEKDIFRLTVLRTFDEPFSYSLEHNQNKTLIRFKMTDGNGGFDPGKMVTDTTITLENKKFKEFMDILKHSNFDTLSYDISQGWGTDGSMWHFEYHTEDGYKLVSCFYPSDGTFMKKIYSFFEKNTGIIIERIY